MAKSLRSKSKRAFRKLKRDDPKSDYHTKDKLRTQRLHERLQVLKDPSDDEKEEETDDAAPVAGMQAEPTASGSKPGESNLDIIMMTETQQREDKLYWLLGLLDPDAITLADSRADTPQATTSTQSVTDDTMQEGVSEPTKKISTSGPRESSREQWRKKRGLPGKTRNTYNSTTFSAKKKNYKSPGRVKRARNA